MHKLHKPYDLYRIKLKLKEEHAKGVKPDLEGNFFKDQIDKNLSFSQNSYENIYPRKEEKQNQISHKFAVLCRLNV